MKKASVYGLSLVIVCSFVAFTAQDSRAEPEALTHEVTDDLAQAAKEARVQFDDKLVKSFAYSVSSQSKSFTQVYNTVPKDARVTRLARYLTAKSKAKTGFPSTSMIGIDLSDFHWGYIASDFQYSSMRLDSAKTAKLRSVESSGEQYIFGMEAEGIKPDSVVLLPVATDQGGANVTAMFDLGNAKALWTGSPSSGHLKVVAAGTSKGCEIFVKSTPPKAVVYFNRKEWYEPTNTSVVQDPGSWEVLVRLQGYKEWREQRSLDPGESWTINAVLVKQ